MGANHFLFPFLNPFFFLKEQSWKTFSASSHWLVV